MASLAESITNPYLNGKYAPVHDEVDVAGLDVTGELPVGLSCRVPSGFRAAWLPAG